MRDLVNVNPAEIRAAVQRAVAGLDLKGLVLESFRASQRLEVQRSRDETDRVLQATERVAWSVKKTLMAEAARHGPITLMRNPRFDAPSALEFIPAPPAGSWRR